MYFNKTQPTTITFFLVKLVEETPSYLTLGLDFTIRKSRGKYYHIITCYTGFGNLDIPWKILYYV